MKYTVLYILHVVWLGIEVICICMPSGQLWGDKFLEIHINEYC